MIAPRLIPPEYAKWNRRWGSPYGWRHGLLAKALGDTSLGIRYRGPFAFQGISHTRRFEFPWAYHRIREQGDRLTVVEIGGGFSGLQFVLAKEGYRVTNVDPGLAAKGKGWPIHPARHQRIAKALRAPVTLLPTTIGLASIAPASADVVLCLSVLEHLTAEELAEVGESLGRLLKPNGVLVLTVDLFLDTWPFTTRQNNKFGTNVDVFRFLSSSGLSLLSGEPSELCGFPQFSCSTVLERLADYLLSQYPCVSQCLVARRDAPQISA